MSAFIDWFNSPIGVAVWVGLTVAALLVARLVIGPSIWSVFTRAAREDLAFYRTAMSPWSWLRLWRAWRARK